MIRLIGQIKYPETDNLIGFVVADIKTNKARMIAYNELVSLMSKGLEVKNAKLDGGDVVGTEASLKRLPEFAPTGSLLTDNKVSVLGAVVDDSGVRTGKYYVMDSMGRKRFMSEGTLISYIDKFGATNVSIKTIQGKHETRRIISGILSEIPTISGRHLSRAGVPAESEEVKKPRATGAKGKYIPDRVFASCFFTAVIPRNMPLWDTGDPDGFFHRVVFPLADTIPPAELYSESFSDLYSSLSRGMNSGIPSEAHTRKQVVSLYDCYANLYTYLFPSSIHIDIPKYGYGVFLRDYRGLEGKIKDRDTRDCLYASEREYIDTLDPFKDKGEYVRDLISRAESSDHYVSNVEFRISMILRGLGYTSTSDVDSEHTLPEFLVECIKQCRPEMSKPPHAWTWGVDSLKETLSGGRYSRSLPVVLNSMGRPKGVESYLMRGKKAFVIDGLRRGILDKAFDGNQGLLKSMVNNLSDETCLNALFLLLLSERCMRGSRNDRQIYEFWVRYKRNKRSKYRGVANYIDYVNNLLDIQAKINNLMHEYGNLLGDNEVVRHFFPRV